MPTAGLTVFVAMSADTHCWNGSGVSLPRHAHDCHCEQTRNVGGVCERGLPGEDRREARRQLLSVGVCGGYARIRAVGRAGRAYLKFRGGRYTLVILDSRHRVRIV